MGDADSLAHAGRPPTDLKPNFLRLHAARRKLMTKFAEGYYDTHMTGKITIQDIFDYDNPLQQELYESIKDKLRELEMTYENMQDAAKREVFTAFLAEHGLSCGLSDAQRSEWIKTGAHQEIVDAHFGDDAETITTELGALAEMASDWL